MIKKIIYLSFSLLITSSVFAEEKNLLLGKWRWAAEDCTKPDFIFEKDKITKIGDADGVLTTDTYKKIKYTVEKNFISVDFGQQHGFGGAKSKTQLTFKVIDKNHVVIERKKALNDLHRCQ